MIRVEAAPEPADFDKKVRARGLVALQKWKALQPKARKERPLPSHWTKCIPALRKAYSNTCAYLGMRISEATANATVDHFKPKSKRPDLAYEWSNFRLASARVNSKKGEHEDVLDPFAIENGWFELDIGTFEVRPGRGLSKEIADQVRKTIQRLDLNDRTYKDTRARFHDFYLGLPSEVNPDSEMIPLSWLKAECAYVATELERQGLLRPEDAG